MVINYDMATLANVTGSVPYLQGLPNVEAETAVASGLGHMSIISAYHKETDRFLLLDTWPGTPSGWATAADLFVSCDTTDITSGKKRGLVVLSQA